MGPFKPRGTRLLVAVLVLPVMKILVCRGSNRDLCRLSDFITNLIHAMRFLVWQMNCRSESIAPLRQAFFDTFMVAGVVGHYRFVEF